MGITEIILLVVGAIIFILSFILPDKKELSGKDVSLAKDEISDAAKQEIVRIKSDVEEVVDETVKYAMEKAERSLERLSTEKIMAVGEYSETVLAEIHKNHEEVMFLYDMLNSKHTNLKNTVSEVNKSVKEAEEAVSEIQKTMEDAAGIDSQEGLITGSVTETEEMVKEETDFPGQSVSFLEEATFEGRNNNEKILELYRQGKSKIAIAKELGLGVGEVKLVIDLFKNQ